MATRDISGLFADDATVLDFESEGNISNLEDLVRVYGLLKSLLDEQTLKDLDGETETSKKELAIKLREITQLVASYNTDPINFYQTNISNDISPELTSYYKTKYDTAMVHMKSETTSQTDTELKPIAEMYAKYHTAHNYITKAVDNFKEENQKALDAYKQRKETFDIENTRLEDLINNINNYINQSYYKSFNLNIDITANDTEEAKQAKLEKLETEKDNLQEFLEADNELISFLLTHYTCADCKLTFDNITRQKNNLTDFSIIAPPTINNIQQIYEISKTSATRNPIVIIYHSDTNDTSKISTYTEKYTEFATEFNRLYAKYQATLIKYVTDKMKANGGYNTLFDLICIINSLIKLVLELNAKQPLVNFNNNNTNTYINSLNYTHFNAELKDKYTNIFLHYNFDQGDGKDNAPYGVYYDDNKTLELFDYNDNVNIDNVLNGEESPFKTPSSINLSTNNIHMPILIARRFAVNQLTNKNFDVNRYFKDGIKTEEVARQIQTIKLSSAKPPTAQPQAKAAADAAADAAAATKAATTQAQAAKTPAKAQAGTPPSGPPNAPSGPPAAGQKKGGYRQSTSRHSKRKLKKLLNKQSKRLNK